MKLAHYTLIFLLLLGFDSSSQVTDSLPYNSYRDKIVWYSDLGFKAAPFTIRNDFPNGLKKLSYKHNINPILGFGVHYKWFGLRLGIGLPVQIKSVKKYGRSNYTDLGVKFTIKKTFWDIDAKFYEGFAIKDAYKWNDTLSKLNPNDLRQNTRTTSFAINSWYFKSKNYKMQSVMGIAGDFKESIGTWYFKSNFSVFGVGNKGDSISNSIIPFELTDSTDLKSRFSTAYAIDLGFVPGYAYTYRNGYWQVSAFGGLGAALQAKAWSVKQLTRAYIGLAPRLDIRLVAGYSKPKYFFTLITEFDIKSIKYLEMKYQQTYYSIQFMAGIRLDKKVKDKKKKKAK